MKVIKLALQAEDTGLIVSALDAIAPEQLAEFPWQMRQLYLSIRNHLEPRINQHKRKATYQLRLLLHEAYVVEFALIHYAAHFPDEQQVYIASACRKLLTLLQPQLL